MKKAKNIFAIFAIAQATMFLFLSFYSYCQRTEHLAYIGLSIAKACSVMLPYLKWGIILVLANVLFLLSYLKLRKSSLCIAIGSTIYGITILIISPLIWLSSLFEPIEYSSTNVLDYPTVFATLPITMNDNSVLPTGISGSASVNSSLDFESKINLKGDKNDFNGYLILMVNYQGEGGKEKYRIKKESFLSSYSKHQSTDYTNDLDSFVFYEDSYIKNTTVVLFSDEQNTIKYFYTFGTEYEIFKSLDNSVSIRQATE